MRRFNLNLTFPCLVILLHATSASAQELISVDFGRDGQNDVAMGVEPNAAAADPVFAAADVWNDVVISGVEGVVDPAFPNLLNSTGGTTPAGFSITGIVGEWRLDPGPLWSPPNNDYFHWNNHSNSASIDWRITGLAANAEHALYLYGVRYGTGPAAREFEVFVDTDGDGDLADETPVTMGGTGTGPLDAYYASVISGASGMILGRGTGRPPPNFDNEANWAGFQIAQLGNGPEVDIDIKSGSCPNSWNREGNGVLPVAILGTQDFDATQIDVLSVTISRADGVGGSVAPNEGPPGPHSVVEDVGTPFEGEVCDCHEAEGDGFLDLSMKFKTQDVADLFSEDDLDGALVPLVVSGTLFDGRPFTSSSDCVRLVPPGSPPNQVTVQSMAGSWVEATPLDNQLDGGGFGSFQRTYPHTTVLTLTGPASQNGNPFVGWKLDEGELVQGREITLVVNNAEHNAKAVFKKASGCGLGVELVLLVPALIWLHGRSRRRML